LIGCPHIHDGHLISLAYFCGSKKVELHYHGRLQQRRDQEHREKVAQRVGEAGRLQSFKRFEQT
jgi:hypothetical protein